MLSKTWNNTVFTQIPEGGDVNWPLLTLFFTALADNAQTTNIQKSAIRVATTSPVTVVAVSDHVVVTKLAAPGAVTVNLPAGSNGQEFTIVDGTGDASSNNVTINRAGSDTINGSTTYVIGVNRGCIKVKYSAAETDWKIIEGFIDGTLAVTATSTTVFTNKDYDGGTAGNTRRITLPKDTTTNLNALTRKAGTIVYDTTLAVPKFDNGSALGFFGPANAINAVSSADYTVLDGDGYGLIAVSTGNSDRTVTLPTAADNTGRTLKLLKTDTGTGKVIVDGEGAEAIDGVTVVNLYKQYENITIYCNGTAWFIIGSNWAGGTFTPTYVNGSNMVQLIHTNAYFRRTAKDRCRVDAVVSVDPSLTNTATTFTATIPFGANFANAYAEANGIFMGELGSPGYMGGDIFANVGAQTVTIEYYTTTAGSSACTYYYEYTIK